MKTEKVSHKVESRIPYYIVIGIWLVGSLVLKMYRISSLIILTAVSAVGFIAGKKYFDGTVDEIVEVYEDKETEDSVKQGKELSVMLKAHPETEHLAGLVEEINKELSENENNKKYLGKLYRYYVPQLLSLIGTELDDDKEKKAVSLVEKACTNVLNSIREQKIMELTADMQTLESLLKMDGVIEAKNEKD